MSKLAIYSISNREISALASRADANLLSISIEEVRGNIDHFLNDVIRKSVLAMEYQKLHTLTVNHVEPSLPHAMFSVNMSDKRCKAKSIDCEALIIRKRSFERVVRDVLKKYVTNSRVSSDAFLLLQYATEEHIVNLLRYAKISSTNAKRKYIQPKDIHFSRITADQNTKSVGIPRVDDLENFVPYIKKVLPQVSAKTTISKDAVSQINFIVNIIIHKMACGARALPGKTLTHRQMTTVIRQLFPGELANHAIQEGTKALTEFETNVKKPLVKRVSNSSKAGLLFSISRVSNVLRSKCSQRLSMAASVFVASVVEYLCAEILGLSSTPSKSRISAKDLHTAIDNDSELDELISKLGIRILH